MTAGKSAKVVLGVLPLILLVLVFFAFIGYVSWSLHLFYPAPLILPINCSALDKPAQLKAYLQNRTVLAPSNHSGELSKTKCWGIKKRWYLPSEVPDSMEVHHPVYYIRIVSKDYLFFEEVFTMMYSPIHFYCYPIASTASESFETKVRFLGECVLNVIVPPGRFDTSQATEIFRAHAACFDKMDGFRWKHLLVSEENEVPLQSVHFISDLMRRVDTASKIGHEILTEENSRILGDPTNSDYEAAKESLLHDVCNWLHGRKEFLGISRTAASHFYPLVQNATLQDCLKPLKRDPKCITGHYDEDNNCIWGMENIKQAKKSRSLFTRADPSFDLGFVQCVHEFVYARTYNPNFYNIRYGSH